VGPQGPRFLKLAVLLSTFVEKNDLGLVYIAPFDVVISDTDVVQPGILFVSKERISRIEERGVHGSPDLVVEILSRSTAERDRTVKAKLYARAGVRELWLLDPDAKTIEILVNTETGFYRDSILGTGQTARPPLLPDLAIEVAKLFV
jgi:Uma2 family endonuclease